MLKWLDRLLQFPSHPENTSIPIRRPTAGEEDSTRKTLDRAQLIEQRFDNEFNGLIAQLDSIRGKKTNG